MGREDVGLLVLNHTCGIGWDAFSLPTLPVDAKFVQVTMTHGTLGQFNLPVAIFQTFHLIGGTFTPIVELPDEINVGSIGGPFTEHPTAILCTVQTIVVISVSKLHKLAGSACKFGYLVHSILMAPVDSLTVGFQPRVIVDNRKILFLSHNRSVLFGELCKGTI